MIPTIETCISDSESGSEVTELVLPRAEIFEAI